MIRTRLPHPLTKRKPNRRHAWRRKPTPARRADQALRRARHAGGPVDRASYACQCGYVFLAPVSTTVACPHCQAQQAW